MVGINTAVAASNGSMQASNIGFVIPIANALAIAHQLIDRLVRPICGRCERSERPAQSGPPQPACAGERRDRRVRGAGAPVHELT